MEVIINENALASIQEASESLIPQTKLEAELAAYQCMPNNLLPTVDVLNWWRKNAKRFPLLARAAKKYLAVQATSCAVERTFSSSGNVVTSRRTLLVTRNVEMIVYIKENLPKIDLKFNKMEVESPTERDDEEYARKNPSDESELPFEI